MSDRLGARDLIEFDQPGTLPRPGPMGRAVRLLFGVLCAWLVWQLALHSDVADLFNPGYWFWAAFGLVLTPYVINIGFGKNFGVWPRVAVAAMLFLAAGADWASDGNPIGRWLWTTTTIWMIYLYGHLALSFLLSAALATPGCEMRALPHLLGIIRGQDTSEHYCPGFIDRVDRWELGRAGMGPERAVHTEIAANDLSRTPMGIVLLYVIPLVALNVVGNFGSAALAYFGAAGSFGWLGAVCLINAWRCGRVHCYFNGPWFLIAGGLMIAEYMDWVSFGDRPFPLLVYGSLLVGGALYYGTEKLWGRYFQQN